MMWDKEIALGVTAMPLSTFALGNAILFGVITWLGTRRSLRACELSLNFWPVGFGFIASLLTYAFVVCVLVLHSQDSPVVLPSEVGRNARAIYHLLLFSLLLMITATDLRSYYVLERTCWIGMVIGIVGATASGEFQIVHVWIDWNQEQPQLRGPYFPEWLDAHRHLHGLAWSGAGILAGALVAWSTKKISEFVLAAPSLGSGDIFIMAMIGAFLGWQPTLIAFGLSPLIAIVIGGVIRTVSNRPALPYGPFLAVGAMTTLFAWKWIWGLEVPLTLAANPDRNAFFAIRRFFGDWIAMLMIAGLAVGLLIVLLSLLRVYKSIDLKRTSDS